MGRRSSSITRQFAPRHIEMLESPAYRALSLAAHRVLSRIEIEMAHHGGGDNGALPVTYDDFVEYGVNRHSIRPAINELEALGFIEITRKGRAGNAEFREPNQFRLTFRASKGAPGDGTHEWRSIKTAGEAERLSKIARAEKTQNQCRKIARSSDGNRHRKWQFHSGQTATTAPGAESVTTLDISGNVSPTEPARVARLPQGAEASEPAGPNKTPELEDHDKTQVRLAERIGKHGWSALVSLPTEELNRVTELEAKGLLDEHELDQLRALAAAPPRAGGASAPHDKTAQRADAFTVAPVEL